MERIDHSLPWGHLGCERQLSVFRFGSGERKAYIQASLHADELPGMRAAWELKKRLTELEQQGALNGVIELVPVANPMGLGQLLQGAHQGRFEVGSGKNFNRDFVELSEPVAGLLEGKLGDDPRANVRLIRQAMRDVLNGLPPAASQLQGMQRLLLAHACDADVVLDLHCDAEAALHMYALPQHWPQWRSLSAHLNVKVGLLAEDSGGSSFDEACSLPWLRLSRLFPRHRFHWRVWPPPLSWAARPIPGATKPSSTPKVFWRSSPNRACFAGSGLRPNSNPVKGCHSKAPNCCSLPMRV